MVSKVEVDKIDPQSGTSLEVGSSGDTINVPSGAILDINSGATIDATGATITGFDAASDEKVKVSSDDTTPGFLNGKLVAGTSVTLTEGSGGADETFTIAYSTPATLPAASGVNLTALTATNLGSGTVPTARLGSGTGSSSNFLRGDSSWQEVTGGLSWQSVQTSTVTAVAGNGYPVNTTAGVITMNLPAGVVGEQVGVVDYAGTFDTNNLTISANGSEKIKGATDDVQMITERQAGVMTYVDATQGWVLTSAAPDPGITPTALYVTATGGTITTCGDYKMHKFTGDGTFTVSCVGNACGSNTVEHLVVAGGGGGGYSTAGHQGGGGGAGGYRQVYPVPATGGLSVPATPYPITVGGGGSAGNPQTVSPNGSNSIFSSITSAGGGGGGGGGPSSIPVSGRTGADGGSGGGTASIDGSSASGGSGNTPPSPVSQGNAGGAGDACTGSSGSGGGIGGAGDTSPGNTTLNPGGAGSASTISGSSVTYSVGGANAAGPAPTVPANEGSGGIGAGGWPSLSGNAGGSGIVIIRYKYQ